MGTSLIEYLRMKVHPLIQNESWDEIIVKGDHQRDPSQVEIASNEKRDKDFNWMRPTASVSHSGKLRLHVFPSHDYVKHYAAIIATYLALKGGDPSVVRYIDPTEKECLDPIVMSNLALLGRVDIVVLGDVEGLLQGNNSAWSNEDKEELFSWKTVFSNQGYRIAFLGCRTCFWGDIGGTLIRRLQTVHLAKCVFYVGKLGSLRAEHVPNRTLATGNRSFVDGVLVEWQNPLEPYLRHAPSVAMGVHCCLASVLEETKEWCCSNEKDVDFVDPEIGNMAKASLEGGSQFGYLHIVSDNLAQKYDRDLSNERLTDVRQERRRLMDEVREVLAHFFDEWTPAPQRNESDKN